ncbi:MAG TPA: S9 family peptidase [Lutibacter sp.]|nr:S9 family peptidase [Lutibacter sp.]
MRYITLLVFIPFFIACTAQKKQITQALNAKKNITLEDIWKDGTFRTQRMNALKSMQGDYYTLLDFNRNTRSSSVVKYSYQTLEKVAILADSKDMDGLDYFESYTFNKDETKLLLKTDSEPIYRRSENAYFYVYDLKSKKLQKVSENKIQEATFSPDSKRIAYVFENNIYILNLESERTNQITFDGKVNHIINGITDWVYEEEFGFVRAFQWNATSTHLAFLRFNETEVSEFTMMQYGEDLYPYPHTFKYPKAGEKNSEVSLYLYKLGAKSATKIDLGNYEYIPRLKWTKDANLLSVQTTNRRQNSLKLHLINSQTQKANLILDEKSNTYVNVRNTLTFLKDNSFIWQSDQDGFDHLYHYNADGKLRNQITKGNWDVIKYYGIDEVNKKLFYQSVEDGSINKTVFSISFNGKNKKRISPNRGINTASFSRNKKYFINNFSDAHTPNVYTLHTSNGKLLKEVKNNKAVLEKLKEYNISQKEFSTITTKDGTFNMWMLKPTDFDVNKKYPVLMYQYSGPGVQTVQNRWNGYDDYWYQMLAAKGYIVVSVDGRGTGGKGSEFTKITYKELGKYETIDQIEAAKELGKRPYIDAERIGIWGWSFGGYTSSNALLKGNDVFKMAIAVAPVTNWRLYDTVYTERYMQTPQENASGYDDNSPLFFADKLKLTSQKGRGNYLIIHGTADDNVHVQNSMHMINALIKADVPFDSELYPDRTHGIYRGQNTRLHLYKKMTDFILENL